MPEREFRTFAVREMRVATDAEEDPVLRGYAAVFNSDSLDLGGFIERIAPGAFSASLQAAEDDPDRSLIHAFWNHDSGLPLGSTRSGKLKLEEDAEGLAFELSGKRLNAAQLDAVQDGDMRMSFGFFTRDDHWEKGPDGTYVRTLLDVELFEVSPVSQPAYPDTSVALRSAEAAGVEVATPPAQDVAPPAAGGHVEVLKRKLALAQLT